jgi:hypothetical protein
MRHHFNVTRCDAVEGVSGEMRAICSCGWTLDDPAYRWPKDGNDVRALAWDAFEDHVRTDDPNVVVAWQLIGWYGTIASHNRTESTRSDGAIFSSVERGREYIALKRFVMERLERVMLPPDDPQIDFHLLTWSEKCDRIDSTKVRPTVSQPGNSNSHSG